MNIINILNELEQKCNNLWYYLDNPKKIISTNNGRIKIFGKTIKNEIDRNKLADYVQTNNDNILIDIGYPFLSKSLIDNERIIGIHKWRKDKIVYRFSNELLDELILQSKTMKEDYATLPKEVIEYLPYDSFLVEIPKVQRLYPEISSYIVNKYIEDDELKGLIITAITTDFFNEEYNSNNLLILTNLDIFFEDNLIDNFQLKEKQISEIKEVLKILNYSLDEDTYQKLAEYRMNLTSMILTLCLYISSSNADIEVHEKTAKRRVAKSSTNNIKNKKAYSPKDLDIYKVGYNYATAIRTVYKEHKNHNVTGTTKSPHMRKGHFRQQHYGKGNKKIKTVWISPLLVNKDLGSPDTIKINIIE